MKQREPNAIDYMRAFGCFSVVWYHSSFYWNLNLNERILVDSLKFYFISWAMPFFYTTAFYFMIKNGYEKISPQRMYLKMSKMLLLQVLVISIYAAYKGIYLAMFENINLTRLIQETISKISIEKTVLIILSGYSTPAYFLAQMFILYVPITLIGKLIFRSKIFTIPILAGIFLVYISGLNSSLITREVCIYLIGAILVFMYTKLLKGSSKQQRAFLIFSLVVLSFSRLMSNEFILFGVALWFAYIISLLNKTSRKLSSGISLFGYYYSLYIFLFHTLFFWILEPFILVVFGRYELDSLGMYFLINIVTFVSTAGSAVLLRRKLHWILRF